MDFDFEAFKKQVDAQSALRMSTTEERVLNLWYGDEFLATVRKPEGRILPEDYLKAHMESIEKKTPIRKGRQILPYLREMGYEKLPDQRTSRDPDLHWWLGKTPPTFDWMEDQKPRVTKAKPAIPGSGPVVATPGVAGAKGVAPGVFEVRE
jgi:hypothetical protein